MHVDYNWQHLPGEVLLTITAHIEGRQLRVSEVIDGQVGPAYMTEVVAEVQCRMRRMLMAQIEKELFNEATR